ncbi:DUF4349 domain-containing protein [Nocardiopsis alba]|uniref:DUF4349 domain-containing protein n=1 Tax=Nocardiopsis alba TaxID=53437 RepID=UPI00365D7F0D
MDTSPPSRTARAVGSLIAGGLAALLLTSCGASTLEMDASAPADGSAGSPERAALDSYDGEGAEADEAADPIGTDIEVDERALVHTAYMTVRVEDVSEAAELAKELTVEADGHVASERVSTPNGEPPEGELTLRVPVDGYEEALEGLAALGDRSDLERSVEDVTEEVADVESRVASSEAALETLRGHLEKAEDVDDLLRVEREIQDRQESLEAFQARLEALRNQTAYSTVHLSLRPPATYLEERPSGESIGFLGGLERGWRALVGVAGGLAVAAGWLLPFALAGALIGAGPLWWWRRRRAATPSGEGAGARPAARGRSGSPFRRRSRKGASSEPVSAETTPGREDRDTEGPEDTTGEAAERG